MNQSSLLARIIVFPFTMLRDPQYVYYRMKYLLMAPFYQSIILPIKVKRLRKKSVINVLYVLNELGTWKTETLYLKMLEHLRFNPRLLLVPGKETPEAIEVLKQYLDSKKYKYEVINDNGSAYKKQFDTDIIFYQKPYDKVMDYKYTYLYHLDKLFCYVLYGFRNRNYPQIRNYRFVKVIWQFYAENEKVIEESIPVFSTKGKNLVCTGLSFMDDLLLDKSFYPNPWNDYGNKKKIIYAPHHSIVSELYEYSTFLDYCDFMLEMAVKYKDKVQWSFKPHPVLKSKLYELWGEDKTNEYYKRWEEMNNTQVASGDYMGLFKYSDAMIHDCGSFRLEYLYTGNPVMYLYKGNPVSDYMNWESTEALNLHYKGYNKEDIERFINDVIKGYDPLKTQRDSFVSTYLTPPNGKTACENIINAILGQEEYSS